MPDLPLELANEPTRIAKINQIQKLTFLTFLL